jgi:hypothetical protein
MTTNEKVDSQGVAKDQPFRVRLPGFIRDEEIGLGDLVKRVTYAAGIRPCGGCEGRAAALNRRVVFTR